MGQDFRKWDTGLARLLFRTLHFDLRLEVPGTNPYESCDDERFLYCVWHDSILIPTFAGKHRHAAALISRHMDGTFVCDVLRAVGMSAVRGSTNHGGASAIRQLITISKNQHIVITPDGPRGPRRRMSNGIVFLASQTGRAVVPTAYSCTNSWTVRGKWTDLVIPKPFSTVFILAGKPVVVPKSRSRDDLRRYRVKVQAEMDRLNAVATKLVGDANRHDSDVKDQSSQTEGDIPHVKRKWPTKSGNGRTVPRGPASSKTVEISAARRNRFIGRGYLGVEWADLFAAKAVADCDLRKDELA